MSPKATRDDLFLQRELHRLVDVFLGTHAHRAARAGNQLDLVRQGAAQAGHGDGALVAAADIHDAQLACSGSAWMFSSQVLADVLIADSYPS